MASLEFILARPLIILELYWYIVFSLKMTDAQADSRYLLIARAGKNSAHESYTTSSKDRAYDVLVYAYDESVPKPPRETDHYICHVGEKISSYAWLFQERPDLLDSYDYIAWMDDDLESDTETINTCFQLGSKYGLNLWQPSLTRESFYSYAAFLTNPLFTLRYTNFVEMQCPFFKVDTLREALPLFGMGYIVGLDLVWSRLHDDNMYKAAILDCVTVKHTRSVGLEFNRDRDENSNGYQKIVDAFLDEIGETWHGNVVYSAILKSGAQTNSRLLIALRYLHLLLGLPTTPEPKHSYVRKVATVIRHVLTRPIGLQKVSLPSS